MRQDVDFDAEGVTLRGWLYVPEAQDEPAPAVVMAHGSLRSRTYLDRFAEAFSDIGLTALFFDNRNFGAAMASRVRRSIPERSCATTRRRC